MRWDVPVILLAIMLLGLLAAEVMADLLQPVSDALMAGTKETTQVLLEDVN